MAKTNKENTTKTTKEKRVKIPVLESELKLLNIDSKLNAKEIGNLIRAKLKLPALVTQRVSTKKLLAQKLGLSETVSTKELQKAMLERLS